MGRDVSVLVIASHQARIHFLVEIRIISDFGSNSFNQLARERGQYDGTGSLSEAL